MSNSGGFFAPGKLYLAGEYSVAFGLSSALIFKTEIGIKTTVQSSDGWSISDAPFIQGKQSFSVGLDGRVSIALPSLNSRLNFIFRYLRFRGISLQPCSITIHDQLNQNDQSKFGFGSSGALTVSLFGAILDFYNLNIDRLMLYRLAVMAHRAQGEEGSFGDLAVAAFDHALLYHKPELDPIEANKETDWVSLNRSWRGLVVEPKTLKAPPFAVIYTGISSKTGDLLKKMTPFVALNLFKDYSAKVQQLIDKVSTPLTLKWLGSASQCWFDLAQQTDIGLAPSGVLQLRRFIQPYGVLKMSGAGGGDCALAFFKDEQSKGQALYALRGTPFIALDGILKL